MLRRRLWQASPWPHGPVCQWCAGRAVLHPSRSRLFTTTTAALNSATKGLSARKRMSRKPLTDPVKEPPSETEKGPNTRSRRVKTKKVLSMRRVGKARSTLATVAGEVDPPEDVHQEEAANPVEAGDAPKSLKDALLGSKTKRKKKREKKEKENLPISMLYPDDLKFEPIDVKIPPVPMLSYGLDRVLFNPGIYRLQDPRSLVYNFDPYLEKIMPVNEFDFEALSEYKTSSKDEELLALTKRVGTKFTGSTSSMSGVLQHFHFLLSSFRKLNQNTLSREFPVPSVRFSKITLGPSAVFLRYKDGIYAIDADKSFDSPNIMSWLGHSLEKLLTTERSEFERYRRSSLENAPAEDSSSRCYHYSKQGNMLMRSQLDAVDPRLPGTGVFDLKTRAVVSIRMNHTEYVEGSGYQLRKSRGEWESFEREYYDMSRATLLKYSLQVRMGRMDGIFIAFHNIERIFGFQYLSLPDMDTVLHGQSETCLGDQEFRFSIALLDELLCRATTEFPETSIRLHVETREGKQPFMYVFAEPVTEEQADSIQTSGEAAQKEFARTVVGVGTDNPEVQAAWHDIKDGVDEQIDEDKNAAPTANDEDDIMTEQANAADTRDIAVSDDVAPSLSEGSDESDNVSAGSAQTNGKNHIEESNEEANEKSDEDRIEDGAGESSDQESESSTTIPSAPDPVPEGPLMGWTLTVRNKVNGEYVDRPERLEELDDWRIEYYIQELSEKARWGVYRQIQQRRQTLVGFKDGEVDKSLRAYRNHIQTFSDRGRRWREEQDRLNEAKGVELYKPLGPGSGAETPFKETAAENERLSSSSEKS